MKNIFKIDIDRFYLLFLVTFFINLGYGQRSYEERAAYLGNPGFYYFVSNPNYNHNISRTEGWGIAEYKEYDEFGDVFYYAINWDAPGQNFQPDLSYQNFYLTQMATQQDLAIFEKAYADMEDPPWAFDVPEFREAGDAAEELLTLMQNSLDDPYVDTQSNEAVISTLNAFFSAVNGDTQGRTEYSYSLVLNGSGNGLVTGNSTNFASGAFTPNGEFLDYTNNSDAIAGMFNDVTDAQFDFLFKNAVLDAVAVKSANNFDHSQFIADVTENYYNSLAKQRGEDFWTNYVSSGDYGWNNGSAETLWNDYMPLTSSFNTFLIGAQTGNKSQMALGAGLFLLDAASFGEGGSILKTTGVGVAGETVKTGLLAFIGKTLPQKIDDIARVWGTKFPIQEMLEGRSYFEDIMGQYRYLKSEGWFHTGDISQFFKGVDFYKGTEVLVDGVKVIYAETAVSMKTTITTNVDNWLASAPVQKNIKFLKEGWENTNGLVSNGSKMFMNNAEIHIYMPKANITPELRTAWMNKLSTVDPKIKFEIKALEDFIH